LTDPVVLDSSVFKFGDFLYWLSGYHGDKILPAVAYTEISIWLAVKKGRSRESIHQLLRRSDITIEYYTPQIAWNAVLFGKEFGDFPDHARDYMIAAHAYTAPRMVITENKRDFIFLSPRVMDPYEFMESKR
jgi:hypothetical protein